MDEATRTQLRNLQRMRRTALRVALIDYLLVVRDRTLALVR